MYKVIGADGKEYGPVSAEVLRQWVAEGRAQAQTKILVEGTTEWKTLAEIPELAQALGTVSVSAASPGPISPVQIPRTNSLAVTGLVCGIISVTVCLCCYGLPFNLAGIVASIAALGQIKNNPQHERGYGMAVAGLVLSIVSLVMAGLMLVIHIAVGPSDLMRRIQRL